MYTQLSAEVYSKIDKVENLEGYEDCQKVIYTLWDSNGSLDPANHTKIGTYSTTTGSDCTDFLVINPVSIDPMEGNESLELIEFSIFPNPSINELSVKVGDLEVDTKEYDWTIVDLNFNSIISGKGNNLSKINISRLQTGNYYMIITDGKRLSASVPFTVVK